MKAGLAQGRATLTTTLSDEDTIRSCQTAGITTLNVAGKSGAVALQGGASSATIQKADIALCSDGVTVHVSGAGSQHHCLAHCADGQWAPQLMCWAADK
jgi:hypothetical protein